MYNALTREYLVNFKRDGELYASRVVTSPEDLEAGADDLREAAVGRARPETGGTPGAAVCARRCGTRTLLGLIPDRVHTAWAQTPFDPAQRRIREGAAE